MRIRSRGSWRRARACGVIAGALSVLLTLHASIVHSDESTLPPEVGYNYQEIETARITAVGGAQRALPRARSYAD